MSALDYFVFTRNLWPEIPDFALGRTAWDNWLAAEPLLRGAPLIDATGAVTAIQGTDADPIRRAGASFEFAKALWDSGGDRVLALKMATTSHEIYAGLAGDAKPQAAEVDAWLAAHTAP